MDPRKLLDTLLITQRLKDTTRHCYTEKGRHESVAEHCWQMTMMAFLMKDAFPEADMDKVIRMCIIHDMGEAFTGDIPAFEKNAAHEETEKALLDGWVDALPEPVRSELTALYAEMEARETMEAKIYKAIDGLEALVSHNISDLSTWLPLEYDMNLTYANDKVAFSDYLSALREAIRADTIQKIAAGKE